MCEMSSGNKHCSLRHMQAMPCILLIDQLRASCIKHTQLLIALSKDKHGILFDWEHPQAALEIKKAQALDYLAGQQDQAKWDLQRPLDRFIEPLNQVRN